MIDAYCWPQSAAAGDTVDLAISSSGATCEVEVVRQGADDVTYLHHDVVPTTVQVVPDDAASAGCGWSSTVKIAIEAHWPSGFYLVRLRSDHGETAHAFFVVRATEPGEALLVLSTSTWAAYNDWGGPSFYTGGHVSSQQRPLPPGFLSKPSPEKYRVARFGRMPRPEVEAYFAQHSYWSAAAGWGNWERLFARWAEGEGIALDYATSTDLHRNPDLLTPYQLYLSVGHDEYWSEPMRDQVEGFVERGGAAAFFSGNTSFWQIRFEHDETQVVGYKTDLADDPVFDTDDQRLLSTMWSDPLVDRPENHLTGVSFTRGGYAHMPNAPQGTGGYTIWRPEAWPFEGLTMRPGDVLGAEPVVVGYECDGCELTLEDGLPVPTGADGTPKDFVVLGTAPAHLWLTEEGAAGLPDSYIGELNWVAERLGGADTPETRARYANGRAVLGTFQRGAGEVFTVGCTDWAYGLGDPAVAQVTRNVLSRYLKS